MKTWYRTVDPIDMTDISIKLTEMYGYPWSGPSNSNYWWYSSGNIRNSVNYFYVYVCDHGNDTVLTELGFRLI